MVFSSEQPQTVIHYGMFSSWRIIWIDLLKLNHNTKPGNNLAFLSWNMILKMFIHSFIIMQGTTVKGGW